MEILYMLKDNDNIIIDITKNHCEELKNYKPNESWINKNIEVHILEVDDGLGEKYKEYLILKYIHNLDIKQLKDINIHKRIYCIKNDMSKFRKINLDKDLFIDSKTFTLKKTNRHYKVDKFFIQDTRQFYLVMYSIGFALTPNNFNVNTFKSIEEEGYITYSKDYPIYDLQSDGTLIFCVDSKE